MELQGHPHIEDGVESFESVASKFDWQNASANASQVIVSFWRQLLPRVRCSLLHGIQFLMKQLTRETHDNLLACWCHGKVETYKVHSRLPSLNQNTSKLVALASIFM